MITVDKGRELSLANESLRADLEEAGTICKELRSERDDFSSRNEQQEADLAAAEKECAHKIDSLNQSHSGQVCFCSDLLVEISSGFVIIDYASPF